MILQQTKLLSVSIFLNDTATTEIYTLSLHDALPISYGASSAASRGARSSCACSPSRCTGPAGRSTRSTPSARSRSEEHTSELQSRQYFVCRLLLEKKIGNAPVCPLFPQISRMPCSSC